MTTPPCRYCFAGVHSKCRGDFTDHCGCRACYNDSDERFRRGPFWKPPDGTPHDTEVVE